MRTLFLYSFILSSILSFTNQYCSDESQDQFARAWKELSRYNSEVKYYVNLLEDYGVTHFDSKK